MGYAIIGAGIAGLTTALAFEKKGIAYQIFERAPKLTEVGAGIWLAPNALQVFEELGVLHEVKSEGNSIDRITLAKANLTPLSDNFQEIAKDRFGHSTVAIHRAKLQKLLFKKIPKEKIHLGKCFESFENIKDGKIKITFVDKSTYETHYLIGADGIHSKVRRQLFPKSKIRYSGQTCWRGLANKKLDSNHQNRGMELWGDQIRFGISNIGENKVYWFAVALDKANQEDTDEITKQKLLKMFGGFHPMVNELISATPNDKIFRNDIIDLEPLDKWHKNNVLLIGDAGHAATPNMGQGGAQAIEDAHYLSKMIENDPNKNVFELFQHKRYPKVNSIVKQSWATGKIAHWKYGRCLRDFLLKNFPKRLLEKKMVEMYKIEKVL